MACYDTLSVGLYESSIGHANRTVKRVIKFNRLCCIGLFSSIVLFLGVKESYALSLK
jgi:hypothetical protein